AENTWTVSSSRRCSGASLSRRDSMRLLLLAGLPRDHTVPREIFRAAVCGLAASCRPTPPRPDLPPQLAGLTALRRARVHQGRSYTGLGRLKVRSAYPPARSLSWSPRLSRIVYPRSAILRRSEALNSTALAKCAPGG